MNIIPVPILISVYDRHEKLYWIFEDISEIKGLIGGESVEELNERYELAIDGDVMPWPHSEPDLIEQYIHSIIHEKFSN